MKANDVDGLRLLLFGLESAALVKPELNAWKVGVQFCVLFSSSAIVDACVLYALLNFVHASREMCYLYAEW